MYPSVHNFFIRPLTLGPCSYVSVTPILATWTIVALLNDKEENLIAHAMDANRKLVLDTKTFTLLYFIYSIRPMMEENSDLRCMQKLSGIL